MTIQGDPSTPEGDLGSAQPTPGGEVPEASIPKAERHRRPWVTLVLGTVAIAVFLGLGSEGEQPSWDLLAKWGAPSSIAIWHGAYWGPVTSVFVHTAIWHLVFNLYWLWVFGSTIEREIGPVLWALFVFVAAFVSSAFQLALSDTTGIGLSGVGYAAFGFLWVGRRLRPAFQRVLTKQVILLFLGWLIGCVIVTALKIWEVGNAAHISGLVFGALAAASLLAKPAWRPGRWALVSMTVLSILTLFWCPWSSQWLGMKAYDAHARGQYEQAVDWYCRALKRGGSNRTWALQNLAYAYCSLGRTRELDSTMEELKKLNPKSAEEAERVIRDADHAAQGEHVKAE